MKKINLSGNWLLTFGVLFITACGGGSGTDNSSSPKVSSQSASSSKSAQSSATVSSAAVSSVNNSTKKSSLTNSSSSSVSSGIFKKISLKSTIDRVQPGTGIVFWADNETALASLQDTVQLEYSYMIYSDVIQEKGKYNWNIIDTLLTSIASRKHQAILRFRYTYPGELQVSVPNYIVGTPGYNKTILKVEGKNTFIPDWSFTELENFTLQFYRDLAVHYDGDPRLALLQVGFGSYAEYHLFDGPFNLGVTFPSKKFQTRFFEMMNDNFRTTPWAISIDAANSEYSPFSVTDTIKAFNFGLFDDSFMHKEHSTSDAEYNRASWLFFGAEKYKTSPMGGEFSYYTTFDQQQVLSLPNGPYGRTFESFASQYHISYIIGSDQAEYQTAARIKQAAMATGYKFHVDSYDTSATQTRLKISNKGIAPFYYDAYPSLKGLRSTTSLKGLLPDEQREFTIDANAENVSLSIESDHLVMGQVIQYEADL
jgi:hypothetical protein